MYLDKEFESVTKKGYIILANGTPLIAEVFITHENENRVSLKPEGNGEIWVTDKLSSAEEVVKQTRINWHGSTYEVPHLPDDVRREMRLEIAYITVTTKIRPLDQGAACSM